MRFLKPSEEGFGPSSGGFAGFTNSEAVAAGGVNKEFGRHFCGVKRGKKTGGVVGGIYGRIVGGGD